MGLRHRKGLVILKRSTLHPVPDDTSQVHGIAVAMEGLVAPFICAEELRMRNANLELPKEHGGVPGMRRGRGGR